MSTVKEVTTAVRPVATLEGRIEMLTQAGLRLQAAESQIQAGGNTSGWVKFTLSKDMMP